MISESSLISNPFKVLSPEGMTGREAVDLFVEVSEFNKIQDPGNTMLNGPRGSGKSMLFRYLMPDCQMISRQLSLSRLDFFAVLVPIKNTNPNITELRRLESPSAQAVLNEHLMTCFVASKVFKTLLDSVSDPEEDSWSPATASVYRAVVTAFQQSGWSFTADRATGTPVQILRTCMELCDTAYAATTQYAKRLSFSGTPSAYDGPLCDYVSFLCPIIEELQALPYFPSKPIYFLVDDADLLSLDQTKVLNSWIATRTSSVASMKLSTQSDYKTFSTFSGQYIRPPHDFQEINIVDVYTSNRGKYLSNVRRIIAKRLEKAELPTNDPYEFFPVNKRQEASIRAIEGEIRTKWPTAGRGYRIDDDVTRYARPEYIRRLGGRAKSTSSYSYSGFEQLVHISSGQARYFLEPAAEMYDEAKVQARTRSVRHITSSIQNRIVRREAEKLFFSDIEKIKNDPALPSMSSGIPHQERIEHLSNLIRFLGHFFYRKLISGDSERRVFSVAISGAPDPAVTSVFEIGVKHGFFHRSSIGNKEGTGRIRLYVLTRRLAPHFSLDPSSFAGYQFITNVRLQQAMEYPDRLLNHLRRVGFHGLVEDRQLELFNDDDIEA